MRWLRYLWNAFRLKSTLRGLSRNEVRYKRWLQESNDVLKQLRKRQRDIKKLQSQVEVMQKAVSDDAERSSALAKRQSEIVEEQRAELEVVNEITIPNLEAACRSYLQRYDTETSIMVKRQVAVGEE